MAKQKWMVELDQVTKIFNQFNKIEDINIQIKKGECFALCGGNGAGKSTIIHLLIGNLKPTSGEIYMDGQKVSAKEQAYKTRFSFMPDAMLFPNTLTGYEVLSFFAELHDVPPKKVAELLAKVGLEQEQHKLVKYYSKGMQQRLSLAQTLLADTPILILDEPTNGLDPYWVKRFKQIIQEEKERGRTILFSSHVLADVEEIADRVAFMSQGHMLINEEIAKVCQQEGERVSLEDVFFALLEKS